MGKASGVICIFCGFCQNGEYPFGFKNHNVESGYVRVLEVK